MSANFTPDQKGYKTYQSFGTFRLFVLENFPFIAEDFDALTYYQMLCKVVAFLQDVITNNESLQYNQTQLLDAFNELQNYVNTYFDNLDVQTEINNKLDQMAQSGELTKIIESFLNVNTFIIQDNVNTMINNINLSKNMHVLTLGYYNINDGGSAYYIISDIKNDYSIKLNNNLYANYIFIDNITAKQFGCVGDGITDDSQNLQKAINYVKSCDGSNTLIIPPGTYLINNTLNIPSNIKICGNSKTMYHDENKKATVFIRKENIIMFNLSGKPYSESGTELRASDIELSDFTLVTDSNEYYDKPLIFTKRSIYNMFNRLVFRGNGKAIFFDISSFDMRFMNCDFVGNCDIETIESYTDAFGTAVLYGTNQMIFFGCRWEGYTKGNLLKFNNYTREMFFFGCKFEGSIQDGNPHIYTQSNNGDIYMYGTRVTVLAGSNTYFANLNDLSRSLFDISYVDNSTQHDNALIKINNTSSINFLFKPTFNINNYQPEYYIENSNTNTSFEFNGTLITLPYYSNAKKLFSNPELMNKNNILFDSSVKSSSIPNSMLMYLTKIGGTRKTWKWNLNYYNFTDEITQLTLTDANNEPCVTFRNGGALFNKRLNIPYLSNQPSTVSNGDILINNYTDTNVPNLTIGMNNSSKRIGWADNPPTSGYWLKGNIIFNNNPSTNVGWICTQTGTPGIWKSFGNIID